MYSITHKTAATRLDTCEKLMCLYKSDSKETIKLQKKKGKKTPLNSDYNESELPAGSKGCKEWDQDMSPRRISLEK